MQQILESDMIRKKEEEEERRCYIINPVDLDQQLRNNIRYIHKLKTFTHWTKI